MGKDFFQVLIPSYRRNLSVVTVQFMQQGLKFHTHGFSKSSHNRCSVKKVVDRNFAKFTGEHLCQRLFFNKVARLRFTTLLKKKL